MQNSLTTDNRQPHTEPALIKALHNADAYGHHISPVSVIETHISWVLLTGEYAYKIKKPVRFGFLDFSTLANRQFFCCEELRLNQRLTADLYLSVVPITGTPGQPTMDGDGVPFEYAIKMRQFPAGHLLAEHAVQRQLQVSDIDQITNVLTRFHAGIAHADKDTVYGEADDIRHWFIENIEQIEPLLSTEPQKQQLRSIQRWGEAEWRNKQAAMQLRKQQGYVRECHGDLHLGNMTLIDGKIRLFDCIEFNPLLRWIDVISDLAFLVIDLLHFDYDGYAYRFLNHYLQCSGDYHGLGVLRYYLVYRALVRAKVSLLRLAQLHDALNIEKATSNYTTFINLAERFAQQPSPQLIISHGFSGAGKSTFSAQLAERLGAIQIRSDIERKRLFNCPPHAPTGSAINQGAYTEHAGEQTYQRLAEYAKAVLNAGFPAIVDAAFLKTAQRELFLQLAIHCAVPFVILDFQVDTDELQKRILQRENDASEATVEVLEQQRQIAQPLSVKEQAYVISITTELANALDACLGRLLN